MKAEQNTTNAVNGKHIVICSDGTGNTFDTHVSNVGRLVTLLEKDDTQPVLYDQGVGTTDDGALLKPISPSSPGRKPSPKFVETDTGLVNPARHIRHLLGLGFGYGLKKNIRQLYQGLCELYQGGQDRIFLFGFSRGAFTVRALAGLIYHCGLPKSGETRFDECFEEAYGLYSAAYEHSSRIKPIRWLLGTRGDELERLRRTRSEAECQEQDKRRSEEELQAVQELHTRFSIHKKVQIHFLGVWDTVKSYGGIRPIVLPHLRHNPRVQTVRHAMALDERRAWFDATTWGRLDLDNTGALARTHSLLSEEEGQALAEQDIKEVWFRGCHSDVGGGDREAVTSMIALRWMVGEAVSKGLRLNEQGKAVLGREDPSGPVEIHESLWWPWSIAAYLHLWEIDNFGQYPVLKSAVGKTGWRNPDRLTRDGKVLVHSTVGAQHAILAPVEYEYTDRGQSASSGEAGTR